MFLNHEFCSEADFSIFSNLKTPEDPKKCKECGSLSKKEIEGNIICINCGANIEGIVLDKNLEINNDEQEKSVRSNFQINTLLPSNSMGTIMRGRGLTLNQKRNHQWNSGTNHKETSKMKNFNKIELLCKDAKIVPAVKEYAKTLFTGITVEKKFRGENHNGVIGACIYYGCKKRNVDYDVETLSKILKINQRSIMKGIDIVGRYIYANKAYSEELLIQKSMSEICLAIADKLPEYNSESLRKKLMKTSNVIEKKNTGENETLTLAVGCIFYTYTYLQNKKKVKSNNVLPQLTKISEIPEKKIIETSNLINSKK